ncbi:MAG: AMP-binding protein [Promethearchaeota archaeon]
MEFGKSKIVIKPSGSGKYKTTWIYVPSKVAKDSSFPFKNNEEVMIEIKNDTILITKNNKRSRMIKEYGIANTTLPKLLRKKAIDNEDQIILFYKNEQFSYKDINENSNQIAWGIIDLVDKLNIKNPKISLMMNNCPDFLFFWFGIIKSGCVFVPINTALKGEYFEHVLNDSDTEILIIDYNFIKQFEEIQPNLSKIKKIFVHNPPKNFEFNDHYLDYQTLRNSNRENPKVNIFDEDPIQILYTEGITGKPKGVIYRNMVLPAINIGYRLKKIGLTYETKIYCPMPLFQGAAQFYVIIPSLFYNIPVVLAEKFNVNKFWEDIRMHNPTVFTYFGGYLLFLLYNNPSKFDRKHPLKWAYGFGAGIELWKGFENRFGIRLYECWSHMEGTGITINILGSNGGKMGSVGKPLNSISLKIVDSDGNELPSGADNVGEIVVKTKTNGIFEYYKLPEFSDVRIDEDDWVYTGDYGYVDDDNFLFFMGKKNEILLKAGEKIYLKEIERMVNSHPSIYLSACIPILNDSSKKDSRPKTEMILYAVKVKNSSLTPKKLSDFLYRNLAYYYVPRYIGFLENLPVGPSTEYFKNEIRNEWENFIGKRKIWDNQIQDYITN